MKANIAYSVLAQGLPTGTHGRRVDQTAFNFMTDKAVPMLDALVPSGDALLRAYGIDDLIQLVLHSGLQPDLLRIDPVNTYDIALPAVVPGGSVVLDTADSLQFWFRGDDDLLRRADRGEITSKVMVNMITHAVFHDFGYQNFTMPDGLSTAVTIVDGLDITFSQRIPAAVHQGLLRYTVSPATDWMAVLTRISRVEPVWSSAGLQQIYETDPLWTNRVAAFTLSAVETQYRG